MSWNILVIQPKVFLLCSYPLSHYCIFKTLNLVVSTLRFLGQLFFSEMKSSTVLLFFCRHEDTGLRPFTQVYREQNVLGTKIT